MKNNQQLRDNLKRISNMMREKGIRADDKSGREFFSGYNDNTLYDWDQYFEGIVQFYVGWDSELFKNGILIFLDNQDEKGFIPRCVRFNKFGATNIAVSLETFDEISSAEQLEMVKPFLAQELILYYKKEGNLDFLNSEYFDKLKKYLNYWLIDRDLFNLGLPVWNSSPHTGMDNQRERAGDWQSNYGVGVDLACFVYRDLLAMVSVCDILGRTDDAKYFSDHAKRVYDNIHRLMWHEQDGIFYDIDGRTGQQIKVKYAGTFATLWCKVATEQQAQRLVKEHLTNPDEFWTPFPIAALSKSEKGYVEGSLPDDVGCSWRAHTWIPTNYYIFQGLRLYGYDTIAFEIAKSSYENNLTHGDCEYYTSEGGKPYGLQPFWGWSLLSYFMPLEFETGYDPTKFDSCIADEFFLNGVLR